jgi:hypothetical protein
VSQRVRSAVGNKLVILACGTIALVCALVAGFIVVIGVGPATAVINSPTQANSTVFAAAMASGSFHYLSVSTGTVNGNPVLVQQSGDAGRGQGVQYLTSAMGDNEVIVIGSMVYMKANATMLENMLGYSVGEAGPFVNTWIAFKPSDSLYSAVSSGVTVGSIWGNSSESPTDGLPKTPASVTGISTLNGMPVESVNYSLNGKEQASNTSYSGTESIIFSATDPHLPNFLTEHMSASSTQGKSTGTVRLTFSKWGAPVNVQAPSSSIPFSTLPPPSSTI